MIKVPETLTDGDYIKGMIWNTYIFSGQSVVVNIHARRNFFCLAYLVFRDVHTCPFCSITVDMPRKNSRSRAYLKYILAGYT
jgi:hypothetical protein